MTFYYKMSSQISDKKTTLIYFCCTKRTRLIVFTFNGIKDSPTAGDKQSTKKLRSATSLAVPMVSVPRVMVVVHGSELGGNPPGVQSELIFQVIVL